MHFLIVLSKFLLIFENSPASGGRDPLLSRPSKLPPPEPKSGGAADVKWLNCNKGHLGSEIDSFKSRSLWDHTMRQ